ncbi:MAG: dihydrofolate reductase family protein [Acidobacteria bacterium]|nr:dihydrofolate reductase family protein [Acidobacteriota bacterium]
MKAEQEKDFLIFGLSALVQSLVRWSLVDEFVLLIDPLALGTCCRLFVDGGTPSNFKLRDVKATANGVVVATYLPAESGSGLKLCCWQNVVARGTACPSPSVSIVLPF